MIGYFFYIVTINREEKICSLSEEYSALLITGPRQVGKTTVLKQLMKEDREYVTFDNLKTASLPEQTKPYFCR